MQVKINSQWKEYDVELGEKDESGNRWIVKMPFEMQDALTCESGHDIVAAFVPSRDPYDPQFLIAVYNEDEIDSSTGENGFVVEAKLPNTVAVEINGQLKKYDVEFTQEWNDDNSIRIVCDSLLHDCRRSSPPHWFEHLLLFYEINDFDYPTSAIMGVYINEEGEEDLQVFRADFSLDALERYIELWHLMKGM